MIVWLSPLLPLERLLLLAHEFIKNCSLVGNLGLAEYPFDNIALDRQALDLAEALKEGVHSADVILNILSRRRDPGPPATIMTPEALRLRHEPAADCARYDSLRRASG